MEPAWLRRWLLAPSDRGFTLVEMLVVLGIIVVVTGIALVGQSQFNRTLLVTDTAYTVALSVRESQSLGLSSKKVGGVSNAGYGVYFTPGNNYVQFADTFPAEGSASGSLGGLCDGHTVTSGPEARPGNCLYEPATADTLVRTYRFERGITVTRICGMTTGGTLMCDDDGLTSIHIVFLRPNTESQIIGRQGSTNIELTSAEIYLEPSDGTVSRGICISKVGQVSVTTDTCS